MTYMHEEATSSQIDTPKSFPFALVITGAVLMLGSLALAGRLIWEMTWLTWRDGPQMIGFSLAHGSGVFLFFFPIALFVWVVACLGTVAVWKMKRRRIIRQSWIVLTCAMAVLGLLAIPPGFWDGLFVGHLARSSHAAEFLVYAAATGENGVVRGLLERGLQVNSTDREGNTALHVAAASGRPDMVTYLIGQGAALNATNLYGDSPLERASANHQTAAMQVLSAHGAQDLKGTAEQRDRATKEVVRRDIEQMNARPK